MSAAYPVRRLKLKLQHERSLLAVLSGADLGSHRATLAPLIGRLKGREFARERWNNRSKESGR